MFEDWGEFGFRFGPFGFGFSTSAKPVRYTMTEDRHVLRVYIDPEVTKEEIRVRYVKPGVLEIEWPRKKGEEIPVE